MPLSEPSSVPLGDGVAVTPGTPSKPAVATSAACASATKRRRRRGGDHLRIDRDRDRARPLGHHQRRAAVAEQDGRRIVADRRVLLAGPVRAVVGDRALHPGAGLAGRVVEADADLHLRLRSRLALHRRGQPVPAVEVGQPADVGLGDASDERGPAEHRPAQRVVDGRDRQQVVALAAQRGRRGHRGRGARTGRGRRAADRHARRRRRGPRRGLGAAGQPDRPPPARARSDTSPATLGATIRTSFTVAAGTEPAREAKRNGTSPGGEPPGLVETVQPQRPASFSRSAASASSEASVPLVSAGASEEYEVASPESAAASASAFWASSSCLLCASKRSRAAA